MAQTFEEIKKRKKATTKSLVIALDPDLASSYEEAKSVLTSLEKRDTVALTAAQKKEYDRQLKVAELAHEEAKEALLAESLEFVLKAIRPSLMDELIASNQPTAKQKREAAEKGAEITWNPETFPAELVAACLVEPQWSEEEVKEMFDSEEWNAAELMTLFMLALEVNNTGSLVDIKKD